MLSNTHFSIAVHILSALAYRDGDIFPSEALAKTVGTNPSFLRRLIGQLREAGLVETRLGKGGGAYLSRPAAKITLHDVYLAMESRPVLTTHACNDKSVCEVAKSMGRFFTDLNTRLEAVLESELKGMTLDDLVSEYVTGKK
ncbi:MAG: Rrf2 family transcriptional regulator [Planctomycetota bacterium]|nr:Rrf2 family transcriptional regulator [Planctomycetota bacterium]